MMGSHDEVDAPLSDAMADVECYHDAVAVKFLTIQVATVN